MYAIVLSIQKLIFRAPLYIHWTSRLCYKEILRKGENMYTANYYSHSTAFVQSKDCNANLITAIDSALSLTVIHYSQTTANVQLMTALIAKSDNN